MPLPLEIVRGAYARCDFLVDLGSCMRERLARYDPPGRQATGKMVVYCKNGRFVGRRRG